MQYRSFYLLIILLFALTSNTFSQSKKEVKKNKIKTCMVVDTEDGKTITDKKILFDKSGEISEETEYDKNGAVKSVNKYNYKQESGK